MKIGPRLTGVLENTNNENFVVWVYLNDKGPASSQMLSEPLSLVTQRSIDRRLKVKTPENVVDMTDMPVNHDYIAQITPHVTKVRMSSKWLNAVSVEVSRDKLNELAAFQFVNMIEIVEKYRRDPVIDTDNLTNTETQNDNLLVDTLNYGTGNALTQITQIKVNLVHNQGIYGQGVLVANFDAGFTNYLTHPAFTTLPMDRKSTWDFHTNSPNLTANSHGQATLSLVGGYAPGQLIGPAFRSSFLLARTEVDPTETPVEMDHWIAAVEWADSLGADVITSSLGYLDFDPPYTSYTWQDMNGNTMPITIAADLAVNKGIVVNNSAANNGLNSTHNTLMGPADGDSVITVGAVTSSGVRASYSSVGPTTDNPPRIKPDVMAMGSGNKVASGTGYSTFGSGTSWACPMSAGVSALILSANKSLTPIQVRNIMRKFASQSSNPDNLMGWGILDAEKSVDSARKLDTQPPVLSHTQPFTNTYSTAPVQVKLKITENGLIRFWPYDAPRLWFRKSTNGGSNWTNWDFVGNSYWNGKDSLYFNIPGTQPAIVQYYFAAGGAGTTPPGTTPPATRFQYTVSLLGIENNNELPSVYKLYNNYPNPFNPATNIKFDLPQAGFTVLTIYNSIGQKIETIAAENMNAGRYEMKWDATRYSSGVYFYKLESNGFNEVKKMLLVK
jgi:hypothetical protein